MRLRPTTSNTIPAGMLRRLNEFSRVVCAEKIHSERRWQTASHLKGTHFPSRESGVREAADIVLLNVASHAAEALNEPPVIHKTRRALSISRRKQRHSDPGQLHQRRLYYRVK